MTNRSSSAARKRRQQQQQRRTTSQTVPNPNPPGPISNLGDDLLLEILIRLPSPSSAARCTPVCQRWRSLVSAPLFINRFVSVRITAPVEPISLITSPDSPPKPILSFLPHLPPNVRRRFKVVDSFNDLVLCGYSDQIEDGYGCTAYSICNPFTKQWVALPLAPRKPLNLRVIARLVCKPRNSKRFELDDDGESSWFDYSDYEFRVVLMYRWQPYWQGSTAVDVFSSGSWGWTEAVRVLDHPQVGPRGAKNVVSCNGELFWSRATTRRATALMNTMMIACIIVFISSRSTPFASICPRPRSWIECAGRGRPDSGTFRSREARFTWFDSRSSWTSTRFMARGMS
ncbi:unnamed protein product [Linum tenue]|uniref:F-box domain-containing protein n=1 Tax=Linum tenue TaxID=586396 RepID=A0AAV0P9I2_9ROSI|nr:unnamed protein product [Linum tenue]